MRPAASRLPGRAHIRTSSSPSWAAPGRAACLRGPGKHLQVNTACTLCQRRCGAERRGEGRSRLQFANALQTADNCRSHSPWQEGAEQQVSYSTCVPPPCRSERLMSEPRGRCWESNVCVAGGHRTLATPPPPYLQAGRYAYEMVRGAATGEDQLPAFSSRRLVDSSPAKVLGTAGM